MLWISLVLSSRGFVTQFALTMLAIMLLTGGPKVSVSSQDVPLHRRFSIHSKRFATEPGAWREILKVYAHEECFQSQRRSKVGRSGGMFPQKILKFRVSEMPFPTIFEGQFNK